MNDTSDFKIASARFADEKQSEQGLARLYEWAKAHDEISTYHLGGEDGWYVAAVTWTAAGVADEALELLRAEGGEPVVLPRDTQVALVERFLEVAEARYQEQRENGEDE